MVTRADPYYWSNLTQSLAPASLATWGTGLTFGAAAGYNDSSFVVTSLWDTRKHETYDSEAIAFNLFRGQCNATWQITPLGTTSLKHANDCTTSSPSIDRPCMKKTSLQEFHSKTLSQAENLQTPLTCNIPGATTLAVWPLFDMLWLQPVLPVWVAAVACMVWAELAYTDGPALWATNTPKDTNAWDASSFPMLKYQAPVTMTKTIPTLHRDRWTLYLVLLVQPILLLVCFVGRLLLYSTPVSSGFGLISLLAGVSKDSLDMLRGAAFSGQLKRPVRVRISVVNQYDEEPFMTRDAKIKYELDLYGRHDRAVKEKTYG